MKRNQLFTLGIILIIFIVLLAFFAFSYLGIKLQVNKKLTEYHTEVTQTNLRFLFELKKDNITNHTLKDLIMYMVFTKSNNFAGLNIPKYINETLYEVYGNRWKIVVNFYPVINAWPVKIYLAPMELWNWDSSIYEDIMDAYGNYWYEKYFDDSNWINATIPLYQGKVVEKILKIDKNTCKPLRDLAPYFPNGVYLCMGKEIDPMVLFSSVESCEYEGDEDHPETRITNDLPKNIEYEQFAYLRFSGKPCNEPGESREMKVKLYKSIPTYNTITDIEEVARSEGFSEKYFVAYMRGYLHIPEFCKETYIEAFWNEIFRLYVNGIFIFANCYNSGSDQPLEKLDNYYCTPLPEKPCIKGTLTWGIVRINITKYVKPGELATIAILSGVPHDSNNPPACFNDIDKYYFIDINTFLSLRAFCIDNNGNLHELNRRTVLPPIKVLELGYNPPNNQNVFITRLIYVQKDVKNEEISPYYSIDIYTW